MTQAVLFDMDGLMIDSESIQSQSFEAVLKEQGKTPLLNELGIVHTVGIRAQDNWKILKKRYELDESINVLVEKKRKLYSNLLKNNLAPMPGLVKLLSDLQKTSLKLAIVSSSSKEHIELVIQKLGIGKYFDLLVSGEHIKRSKPAPDIFLEAAHQLHVVPKNCVALEDSSNGLQAAHDSGMKVIVIPNKYTAHEDFTYADRVLTSLEEVEVNLIISL